MFVWRYWHTLTQTQLEHSQFTRFAIHRMNVAVAVAASIRCSFQTENPISIRDEMKWKSTQRMRLVQYVYESKLSWSFRFWSIFLISQWNRVLSAYIHNTHKNTNWNCWSELPFCYTIVGRCQANTAHNFEPLLKSIFTNCDLQMRKTHHREMPSLSENLHIYDANFYESNFSPIKMTLHTL